MGEPPTHSPFFKVMIMKEIEVKESLHSKLKGILMSLAAITGGAGGVILVQADTYFESVKGVVCVLVTFGVAGIYQLLKRK